jgi:Pro-kumamolisin, activation domain/Bacterial Ig-like domain (group 1)
MLGLVFTTAAATQTGAPSEPLALVPGHILSALAAAAPIASTTAERYSSMTLTVTLNRDDAEGFERYLRDVYDPASTRFHQFQNPQALSDRFGPSRAAYQAVQSYFETQGLKSVATSSNRLTLMLSGPRVSVERSLHVHIRDYNLGDTVFFANSIEPSLPARLATSVQDIAGLNNFARPRAHAKLVYQIKKFIYELCLELVAPTPTPGDNANADIVFQLNRAANAASGGNAGNNNYSVWCGSPPTPPPAVSTTTLRNGSTFHALAAGRSSNAVGTATAASDAVSWTAVDGTGQTVGLLEFDTYVASDVVDYLAYTGQPANLINNLSEVPVNGGAVAGANQDEVLLDINAVMAVAPGAKVVVYDAPFTGAGTSFQGLFNAMVTGGVTVISNSWDYCEDQTTLADVQSIDSIIKAAAASGITVFNGSGDTGSTCRDGSANTISVPADSPNATAVGGSSLTYAPGSTYGSETWWDDSSTVPPAGQGGFGLSQFFGTPSYQAALNSAAMRSVPDVVVNADPFNGVLLCQASAGGCPTGDLYGGTSLAAPTWAGFAALLNQALGSNLGNLNVLMYPLASTAAFHGPSALASDFAHVGLGSPNLNQLFLLLGQGSVGAVSASTSTVIPWALLTSPVPPLPASISADGTSAVSIVVTLRDANGNAVSGKTVTLNASGGSAQITPASATTSVANGAAIFSVTDTSAESLSFSAVDETDGVTLQGTAPVTFSVPPAAGGGISANPSMVPADGESAATIIVTLRNASGNPTPGKLVTIADGGAHATINGPTPGVTDSNGQIQFAATDQVTETVTFTAIDVTDGNLAIPGSATVTYSGTGTTACGLGSPPVAGSGYTITPYITGLPAAPTLFYQDVNFNCGGANNPAFTPSGQVLVSDFLNGNIYELGLAGGVANSSNLINTLTPALGNLVYGLDGELYAALGGENAEIVEVSPTTGAIVRVVAPGLTCPAGLSVDPLSGDLFFDDQCSGAGFTNPSIFRIIDPSNSNASSPTTVVTYAQLPSSANGGMAFAPNGTLFAVSGYIGNVNAPVVMVSGTNNSTVTVTPLTGVTSDYGVAIGATNSDGSAQSLIVEPAGTLAEVPIANPSAATVLASVSPGVGVAGPDGCLYSERYDTVYRLANASGACSFTPTSPAPAIKITPASVSPNPPQGNSETFTATLQNVSSPANQAIQFAVRGANPEVSLVRANAQGVATFTYTASEAGQDLVSASTVVDASTLNSNQVALTWLAGKHVTFLTLNSSPAAGNVGTPVTVAASLADVSNIPATALAGQPIVFALGSASCAAATSATGTASCSITPSTAGSSVLTASFVGTAQYVAATVNIGFFSNAALAPQPTVTIAVKPASVSPGASATLTWSSTAANTCTASGAWSGSEPTSGTQAIVAGGVGSYTYVLTCSGAGGTASAQATLNVVGQTKPVITWEQPAPITYPAPLSAEQLDARANVPGRFTYSPSAGTVLLVGTHTLGVTFTPVDTQAYTTATATVRLQVKTASPIIVWIPLPIFQGQPLGRFQLDAIALAPGHCCRILPGKFVYTPPAGTILSAGTHELKATFTPDDPDFTSVIVHAELKVWARP